MDIHNAFGRIENEAREEELRAEKFWDAHRHRFGRFLSEVFHAGLHEFMEKSAGDLPKLRELLSSLPHSKRKEVLDGIEKDLGGAAKAAVFAALSKASSELAVPKKTTTAKKPAASTAKK